MTKLAPLALLLLTACREDPQSAVLAGSWLCASEPPDYALERSVLYAPDGTLSGRTELETTDAEAPLAVLFSFSGTWDLSGETLTETLVTQRLMRFSENGQNIPLTELPTGFISRIERTLAGQTAQFSIRLLEADSLVLRDTVEGVETVCEREQGG